MSFTSANIILLSVPPKQYDIFLPHTVKKQRFDSPFATQAKQTHCILNYFYKGVDHTT